MRSCDNYTKFLGVANSDPQVRGWHWRSSGSMASMGSQELELIGVSAMPAMNCNQLPRQSRTGSRQAWSATGTENTPTFGVIQSLHEPRLRRYQALSIPPPSAGYSLYKNPAFGVIRPFPQRSKFYLSLQARCGRPQSAPPKR